MHESPALVTATDRRPHPEISLAQGLDDVKGKIGQIPTGRKKFYEISSRFPTGRKAWLQISDFQLAARTGNQRPDHPNRGVGG